MNKNAKSINLLAAIVIAGLLLGACAAPTPQVIRETVEVQVPVEVTQIVAGTPETVVVTATPEPAGEKTTVKIGFIADISGVGYIFSQSQLAGLKIALDELNAVDADGKLLAGGGILGKPVEYVVRDSQLKADVGATIARQMILEDKVDFLLGPTSSGVALAVSEVAKEYKVVIAFHTSNSADITGKKGHPYLVQVVPNTTIEGRAAAQFAATLPYTKWGFIGPDYAFGHDQYNAFAPRLTETNPSASVVNEQWPKLAERDLTPFITALQSAGPEALYGNLWGDQLVTFIQQAAPLGVFDETPYMGLYDTDFMKVVGSDLPEGLPGYSRAPFYAISTEQMQTFIKKHLALTKEYPSDWAIMTYDAVYALKAAAEKAGSTDGDAVATALDDLTFNSLRGELTVRACDHQANVGEYVGTTGVDPAYPFPILKDAQYVPAEEVWNTCEEIAQFRANP
jgi:branched-chain amino acid transport system substrate-binding protein